MIEKTKLMMILVFTLDFLAFCILVGKLYEKMGMSRTVSIILCVVLTAIVAVVFIVDTFFTRRKAD